MRHIEKGASPGVLTGDGATFQTAALRYFADPEDDEVPEAIAKHLKKHAVYEGDNLDHFGSKLFSQFSYYSDPAVKRQLIASHRGKCGFCESFIMDVDVGDVEHYRPKSEVTRRHRDDASQEVPVAHPGYFWLSQTWDNLFLACKQCNQTYKRNFFDVTNEETRKRPNALDAAEQPFLLHPGVAEDVLRRLIRFDPRNAQVMLNPEGLWGELSAEARNALPAVQRTVEILGLNRPRLIQARAEHLVKIRGWFILVFERAALPNNDTEFRLDTVAVPADTPYSDAKAALLRATQIGSEFSALTMDALLYWHRELRPEVRVVQAAQGVENRIRVNAAQLRLAPQIELADVVATRNQDSTEAEAVPDTSDLDETYKEKLADYKKFTRRLKPQVGKCKDAHAAAKQVRAEWDKFREVSGLKKAEDELTNVQATKRMILFQVGGNEGAAKALPKYMEALATEAKLAAARQSPQVMVLLAQNEQYSRKVNELEGPLEELQSFAQDLYEDVVELLEAYRRSGASRAARINRCEALQDALSNLVDFLNGDAERPNDHVTRHIAQNTGYPPEIRG